MPRTRVRLLRKLRYFRLAVCPRQFLAPRRPGLSFRRLAGPRVLLICSLRPGASRRLCTRRIGEPRNLADAAGQAQPRRRIAGSARAMAVEIAGPPRKFARGRDFLQPAAALIRNMIYNCAPARIA